MEKSQAAQVLQNHLTELRAGRANAGGDVQAAIELAIKDLSGSQSQQHARTDGRTSDGSIDPHQEKGPTVSAEHAAALHSADTTRVAPVEVREDTRKADDATLRRQTTDPRTHATQDARVQDDAATSARAQGDATITHAADAPRRSTQHAGDQSSGEVAHQPSKRSK